MNLIQSEILHQPVAQTDHVVYADTLIGLSEIHLTGANLAIYPREAPTRLNDFITGLNLARFPALNGNFRYYECAKMIRPNLSGITKDKEGLELFIDDVAAIAECFSTIVGREFIRFNLQVVKDDKCQYFHSDYNNLRLLCTYFGEGTQWLSNENVYREKLGSERNAEIVIDPSEINELNPFGIGILKGESYLGNKGNGIVHRSPPIRNKKTKRLLLKLDA